MKMVSVVLSLWLLHLLPLMDSLVKVLVPSSCSPISHIILNLREVQAADRQIVAYSASKGAIVSLTLPLTRDVAKHGIRVVTIAPSLFDSRMTAMMSDKVRASLTRVMEFPRKFLFMSLYFRNISPSYVVSHTLFPPPISNLEQTS